MAAVVAAALIAAACGRAEEPAVADPRDVTEPDEPVAPNEPTALDAGGFGDLAGVCHPGDGSGRSAGEVGLTDEQIRLGTLSDKGAAVLPGLNREIYDAAVAFASWCNEHGGIGGREVVIEDLDAKLFEFEPVINDACDRVFALVGGGAAFDDDPNDVRVGCDLINIPGFVVSARARAAPLQVQPVPNPVHQVRVGQFRRVAELYPESLGGFGVMTANIPSTQLLRDQAVEAVESLGFDVVYSREYSAAGETGWRNFVAEMRDAEVKALEFIGDPSNFTALTRAMDIEGWYPEVIVQQTNFYDQRFVVEGGATAGNTLVHSAFVPLELADQNKATADYLALMERYNPNGKVALLGMQAISAFLLFAVAAERCAAGLTRTCVLEAAQAQSGWTGGGLHSPQQPGNAVAGECFLFLEVGDGYFTYSEELTDPTEGIFNCRADNVLELQGDYGVDRPRA
jgi:hypothetical protein